MHTVSRTHCPQKYSSHTWKVSPSCHSGCDSTDTGRLVWGQGTWLYKRTVQQLLVTTCHIGSAEFPTTTVSHHICTEVIVSTSLQPASVSPQQGTPRGTRKVGVHTDGQPQDDGQQTGPPAFYNFNTSFLTSQPFKSTEYLLGRK